jgi:hypothetical protein
MSVNVSRITETTVYKKDIFSDIFSKDTIIETNRSIGHDSIPILNQDHYKNHPAAVTGALAKFPC